MGLIKYFVYLR